jgi:hypothetical protein
MIYEINVKSLAAAPLTFTYVLTPEVSIVTTVSGDARQYANVSIFYGSLQLWSGAMTQLSPKIEIPYDIVAGSTTIKKGGGFTLTVPTAQQNGSVVADLVIVTPTSTVPFHATVASWPLTSQL